jgi:hypothetical protein
MAIVNNSTLTHLLLHTLAHALDARPLDKVRQVEGRLLEAPLALQVLALGAPVPRLRLCQGFEEAFFSKKFFLNSKSGRKIILTDFT